MYIFHKLIIPFPDLCNDCKPVRLVSLHFLQPNVVHVERWSWIRGVELQASLLRPNLLELLMFINYRKQLTDPSSYSLKTVEMNGYALDKGYMELDNKGTSGTSAGGDNNA